MSGMARVKEFLDNRADRGECSLKNGFRIPPPGGIFDHLDLLGRGWGWEMLAPWYGGNDWAPYKNYPKQYYLLNRPESVAQAWLDDKSRYWNVLTPLGSREAYAAGNGIGDGGAASYGAGNGIGDGDGLVPFVSWCVKMEKQFIAEYERQGESYGTADHILSKEIQERALSLKITEDEFPVTAAALMCITKMAELMLERLRQGIDTGSKVTEVRQYALNLMKYRGSNYDCAAAVMVCIAKEAVAICKCLRQGAQLDTVPWSTSIMDNASFILYLLDYELLSASNDNGTAATEAGSSPQIITVEKDYKELGNISYEDDPLTDSDRHAIRQLAENWVDSAPAYLNMGSLLLPPPRIFNHLDLLEKGWGFKRLVPYFESKGWSAYKNYLQRYYYYNNLELLVGMG